jgi:hypothetical protein
MTTNAPDPVSDNGPTPDETDDRSTAEDSHCRDCDPRYFADRACRRQGVEAEAQYIASQKGELEVAKTNYALTRTGYRDQRHSVALEVQDLRHQIRHLVDRVRCLIQQPRVVECLDRAYTTIREQLDECGPVGGCCVEGDCEFDTECEDYDELVRRITAYEAHLERDKACFTTLVAEPRALAKRVADAKVEVHDVAEALTKDSSTIDLKSWYAKALVAQRHLEQIWGGFAETKDFLACLCRVYDCWISAVDAIAVLKGIQGVKDCHRDARAAHCVELATKTADAIVMEYERICCEPCDDSRGDDSCECGHGHRHHRDHHEHDHDHHDHDDHDHDHEGHEHRSS